MHRKILLIGCGGSGKSTLARQLGAQTGLPVIHLDQVYWRPGWEHLSKEAFDLALETLLSGREWIMDGNFDRTLPRRLQACDAVIWLDFPRRVCLRGVISRVARSHGRTRPDMGDGCPERFDPSFLSWVWNFNRTHREKYRRLLAGADAEVIVLRRRREIGPLLQRFGEEARVSVDGAQ